MWILWLLFVCILPSTRALVGATNDSVVYIEGPAAVDADVVKKINLTCRSNQSHHAQPLVRWTGVKCRWGNNLTACNFTLDPSTDEKRRVTCILTANNSVIGKANYSVSFSWSGIARVTRLAANNFNEHLSVYSNLLPLTVECEAVGKPRPDVVLVLMSRDPTRGYEEILMNGKIVSVGDSRLKATYSLRSPEMCQRTDSYRCEAKNSLGRDEDYLDISALCFARAMKETTMAPIVLAVSCSILAVMCVGTAFYDKKYRAEKERKIARMSCTSKYESPHDQHALTTEPRTYGSIRAGPSPGHKTASILKYRGNSPPEHMDGELAVESAEAKIAPMATEDGFLEEEKGGETEQSEIEPVAEVVDEDQV